MEVEFICELIRGIRLIHKFNHTQKCVVNVSQIQRHVKMRSNANDLSLFVCVMSQKRLCYVTTQCVRILKRLQRALKKTSMSVQPAFYRVSSTNNFNRATITFPQFTI